MTTPNSKDTYKDGSGTQLSGLGRTPTPVASPEHGNAWIPSAAVGGPRPPGPRVPLSELPQAVPPAPIIPSPAPAGPPKAAPRGGRTDELLPGSRTVFEFTGEAAHEASRNDAYFGADEIDLSEDRDRESNLRSGVSPWLTLGIVVVLGGVIAVIVATRGSGDDVTVSTPAVGTTATDPAVKDPASVPGSTAGAATPRPGIEATPTPAPVPAEAKAAPAPAPVETKPAPTPAPAATKTEPAPAPTPAPSPKTSTTAAKPKAKTPAKPAPAPTKKKITTDKPPRDFDSLPPPPS